MLGTNQITKPHYRPDGLLHVKEVFYTIQGEGPRAGRPAVFVRLSGCNLSCFFCDTDFDGGSWDHPTLLLARVIAENARRCDLIVLTGGEPMAQQILPFVREAQFASYVVQVETAGTCAPPDLANGGGYSLASLISSGALEIVCSPKTGSLNRYVAQFCRHFKYVTRAGEMGDDGLPVFSTQQQGHHQRLARPPFGAQIYLQPMAESDAAATARNTTAAVEACLKHGYRLSLQQHKIIHLR